MSEPLPALHDPATPAAVRTEIGALRDYLDSTVPPKRETSRNTLIATWNIRKFFSLSETWLASASTSPKRDWRGLWIITEILSRFDIVAVQEVGGNLRALRTALKSLGSNWSFLMTDVTAGDAGNGERMAFVFDSRRVSLSGLAGELVIPQDWLDETGEGALKRQFDRTPYAVSFRSGPDTVLLVTAHIKYGDRASDRIPELKGIARWMSDWASDTNEFGQNFLLLGDFNIDRQGDKLWQAFTETGLTVPDALINRPRSIFATAENPLDKFYDQIAWFETNDRRKINLAFKSGGSVDFLPYAYVGEGLTRRQISDRVSDHFPLWAEFETRRT
jgi:endonuclease/exonuclease/phosphatase family metal-dependent hydrolase